MRILGIDPGSSIVGFGIIDFDGYDFTLIDYGCIKTIPNSPKSQKIQQICKDLQTLLKHFKPEQVGIEEIFFAKNVKTGIEVAECRGAIMHQLNMFKIDYSEYKPLEVKTNICGYGGAKKENVQKMVQIILKTAHLPRPDDAADALAIAICHANHLKIKSAKSKSNFNDKSQILR